MDARACALGFGRRGGCERVDAGALILEESRSSVEKDGLCEVPEGLS